MLNRTDVVVLVVDGRAGLQECDRQLIDLFRQKNILHVVAWNNRDCREVRNVPRGPRVSAKTGENIFALKEKNCPSGKCRGSQAPAGGGLIAQGQLAVLVIPIDKAAPRGG